MGKMDSRAIYGAWLRFDKVEKYEPLFKSHSSRATPHEPLHMNPLA